MVPLNVRTLRMKEEFMTLHAQGLTLKEIAALRGISVSTIYRYLDEIALKAGVTRDSLLDCPEKASYGRLGKTLGHVDPIDISRLREHSAGISKAMQKSNDELKKTLEGLERELEKLERIKKTTEKE